MSGRPVALICEIQSHVAISSRGGFLVLGQMFTKLQVPQSDPSLGQCCLSTLVLIFSPNNGPTSEHDRDSPRSFGR